MNEQLKILIDSLNVTCKYFVKGQKACDDGNCFYKDKQYKTQCDGNINCCIWMLED